MMNNDRERRESGQSPANSGESDPRQVQGYFVQIPVSNSANRQDLRTLWAHIIRYRIMIGLFVLVPLVLSALVVTVMRPVYRSEILLVAATADEDSSSLSALTSQFRGLASITGISMTSGSSKDQAIAVLLSRSFTEDFINGEDLLPVLFSNKWDPDTKQWTATDSDEVPTIADAYKLFDEEIRTISDDASTNLVTLRIEWPDRELAARWANQLIARLNEHLRARDIEEAQRSIEFLNKELEKNSLVELRQGLFSLLQQQTEKIMIANVRQGYAFKVLDPAVVADQDKYVRPQKLATIIASAVIGLFFAIVAIAFRIAWTTPLKI